MNIMFLDMDGVINSTRFEKEYFNENGIRLHGTEIVNPIMVHRINMLLEEFDLKIVWSSDWRRCCKDVEECRKLLASTGILADRLIDRTVIDEANMYFPQRNDEILYYLKHHPEVEFSIIIDDRHDAEVKNFENCFFVHTTEENGFTRKLYEEAREICLKNIKKQK